MLDTLQINDFQSIESADLALGQFTVLLGESDLGKSAILRAIEALASNPAGQHIVRAGATEAQVVLLLDGAENPAQIRWSKAASASYHFFCAAQDGVLAFDRARQVPDVIARTLRVAPVVIGPDEFDVQYHRQFDPPFLVGVSATQRARVLGELSGVNLILLASREARRREQQASQQLAALDRQIAQRTGELDAYRDLPRRRQLLTKAGRALAAYQQHDERRQRMEALIATFEEVFATARRLHVLTETLAIRLAQLHEQSGVLAERSQRVGRMAALRDALVRAQADTEQLDAATRQAEAALQDLRTQLATVAHCPTCGKPLVEDPT